MAEAYAVGPFLKNCEGVATLVLHNAGHGDKERGRESSSQGDLHDVLLTIKKTRPYFIDTAGEIHLKAIESREGHSGERTMKIRGGVFGEWESVSEPDGRKAKKAERLRG